MEEEEDTATDAFAQAAAMMAEANGFRPNESLEPIFPESETLDFQPPSPAAPVVYDAQTDTVDLLQQQVCLSLTNCLLPIRSLATTGRASAAEHNAVQR